MEHRQEYVWVVESGIRIDGEDTEDALIESIWSSEIQASKHLELLGKCFKYRKKSETRWESDTRWVHVAEYELDPPV